MTAAMADDRGYGPEQIWLPASEDLLSWGDDFHDLLLGDHLRMTAYKAAIDQAVQPGMTVLDLGTGTGILADWALHAGAAEVYGIELNETILAQAVRRTADSGHGERFHPRHGLSFEIELPGRVDLIISEILGNLADNEDCVTILSDARRRFLKPDGAMLPGRVQSYLVPVAAGHAHALVRRGILGDEMGVASLDQALGQRGIGSRFDFYYDAVLPRTGYLSAPRLARDYSFDGTESAAYETAMTFAVQRDDTFTGFKGYFVADLSANVVLDISGDDIPCGMTSDSWKHCYLPVEHPVEVYAGDRISLTFARSLPQGPASPFRQAYRWEGAVLRGDRTVARFSQETGERLVRTHINQV